MNVEHENFRLRSGRWFVAAKILLVEERAHGVTKVGVDYDVVTVDLFAARQLDAAGAAAIQQDTGDRCGGVYLSAFFAGDLGEGLADAAKPTHDVVHAMRVLRVRNHGEQTGTVPRRHAQYFDWNVNARRSSSERK